MRLIKYLTEESENIDEIAAIIRRDCKAFLKEIGPGNFLYRGHRYIHTNQILKTVIPRTDRTPSDVPIDWHRWINKFLYKKFGWKPRSEGVFTTSSLIVAGKYGNQRMFFPIGDYKYVYNKLIRDLWVDIASEYSFSDFKNEKLLNKSLMRIFNKYTDKRLKGAKDIEVIFKCKKYYLIDVFYEYELKDKLWV